MAAFLSSRGPRKVFSLLGIATAVFIIYHSLTTRFGEEKRTIDTEVDLARPIDGFRPGIAKPGDETYSKMLVMARTRREDVSWIVESFNGSASIGTAIYVADDPSAPLHPPKNKGHEVMVYLTHIIDYYDNLADVNIFMHSHRYSWHNNELLSHDAIQMVTRLSRERVLREGYMNMRCHWHPGCPDWLHPGATEENRNKKEEVEFAKAWSELFPGESIPQVVSQPCCGQFAVSRNRIRVLPKSRYVYLRDWMQRTPLTDTISGRIFEYVWHFIFTGQTILCPKEHVCYCDGFGLCFGGEEQYNAWWEKTWEKRFHEDRLKDWYFRADAVAKAQEAGGVDEANTPIAPELGKDEELKEKIAELEAVLNAEKMEAIRRGDKPMNRAKEVGREWKIGDGF